MTKREIEKIAQRLKKTFKAEYSITSDKNDPFKRGVMDGIDALLDELLDNMKGE